jgi:S-DNA-T family DNA segregation ATPase FtsK/SpoIIIE
MTDALYNDAIRIVRQQNYASPSLLQRRLRIGYARAAAIIKDMEIQGDVSPMIDGKPRRPIK